MKTHQIAWALLIGLGLISASKADVITVNPAGTYLLTNSDPAPNPTIIDLSSLTFPVHDGDILHLARIGNFSAGVGFPDTSNSMQAVFSSTNTILTSNNLNRVPGALAAGLPFTSSPTFNGNQSTDIPQDFLIDTGNGGNFSPTFTSINIQVPVGAHFLFVGPYDSNYSTNNDPNGDYAISITAAPEPASLAILGLGFASLMARSTRRRT